MPISALLFPSGLAKYASQPSDALSNPTGIQRFLNPIRQSIANQDDGDTNNGHRSNKEYNDNVRREHEHGNENDSTTGKDNRNVLACTQLDTDERRNGMTRHNKANQDDDDAGRLLVGTHFPVAFPRESGSTPLV